jgi:hypothetical protein
MSDQEPRNMVVEADTRLAETDWENVNPGSILRIETVDYRAAIAKHRDTSLRYGISRSIDRELWEVLDGK